jgi:hypothetical protein
LLGASGGQRGKPRHEEVETREGDHVHCQLPQVSVQLAREPEAGGDPRHGEGDQVVQVTIGRGGQLQGSVYIMMIMTSVINIMSYLKQIS